MNKPLLEQIKLPANADFNTYNLADDAQSLVAPVAAEVSQTREDISKLDNLLGEKNHDTAYPTGDNAYEMLGVLHGRQAVLEDKMLQIYNRQEELFSLINHMEITGIANLGNLLADVADIKTRLQIVESNGIRIE